MPKPLDGKFYGLLFRHRDNQVEPPDGWMVFVARDNALLPTLDFYYDECERQGCDEPQLSAIAALIEKVEAWRDNHPDQLKAADVDPDELSW